MDRLEWIPENPWDINSEHPFISIAAKAFNGAAYKTAKMILEYQIAQSIKYPMKIVISAISEETIQCMVVSQFKEMLKQLDTSR